MHGQTTRVLIDAQTIAARLEQLALRISCDYAGKELTVLVVLNGSLIFAADLLRKVTLPLRVDCLSVASYHGGKVSSGEVRFEQLPLPDLQQRHVLVVDDILDSGRTLDAIVRKLKTETAPASVATCVLLSKRKNRAVAIEADYAGFEISDEFVIGYGLDYQELYRNLPHIAVLE